MRRRDFTRLLGGAAVDVCIDCVQFLARGGRTGPEHQPEWSLAAIAARWGPEWVLVSLGDKEAYGSWSREARSGSSSDAAQRAVQTGQSWRR